MSSPSEECRRMAEQARQWALDSSGPGMRRDLVLVERGWLLLAQSYESLEDLTLFASSQQCERKKA